jgi:hypothetical protein
MPADWLLVSWLPFTVLILVWIFLSQRGQGTMLSRRPWGGNHGVRISDRFERMVASGFKRVDGGYLFQPGIGWRLGRSTCYFVNDAQKDAISARLRQNLEGMRRAKIAFIVIVIGVAASLLLARVELPDAILAASVITCAAFLIAMRVQTQRTIGPMLQGLPLVERHISLSDGFEQHSKALWMRLHLLFGLLCILGALVFATQTDWPLVAAFWVLVAAQQFWLAWLSSRG